MTDDHSSDDDPAPKHLQSYKGYTIWLHPDGNEGGVLSQAWSMIVPITGENADSVVAKGREAIDMLREGSALLVFP